MKKPQTNSRRISRFREKLDFPGYVEAPDQESAIRVAIEEFKITNPMHRERLVAERRE